jgi:hypothetical protein
MLAKISSAPLVQANGAGWSFQLSMSAPMVATSSLTEVKEPRRMAWRRPDQFLTNGSRQLIPALASGLKVPAPAHISPGLGPLRIAHRRMLLRFCQPGWLTSHPDIAAAGYLLADHTCLISPGPIPPKETACLAPALLAPPPCLVPPCLASPRSGENFLYDFKGARSAPDDYDC